MTRFGMVILLSLALAAAGESASIGKNQGDGDGALWPQYRHDDTMAGASPLKGGLAEAPGERWTADLGAPLVAAEEIRIEDLNSDGRKEVLRILKDRIICQDLRGKPLWEAELTHPNIIDLRDWAGDGKLGLLVECNKVVCTETVMVSGATGKVSSLYVKNDCFGGHNRTGRMLPGVPGQQYCVWWDGGDRILGTDDDTGYGYLWSFEKGVDQPILRFQCQAVGHIYAGQHLFADMDGDGKDEFVMITHEKMWLYDPAGGKQKAFFSWEPEIRTYLAQIAAVPLRKGERPSLLMINPMIPGVQVIAQDGKTTATRLWKKVVGPKEDQYQTEIRIGPGAPDPFIDLDGDGTPEILAAITNEHGDSKTYLTIFNALTGERIYDKVCKEPSKGEIARAWGYAVSGNVLTIDDLDGDGRPEVFFTDGGALVIANWHGKDFVPRWSGENVAPLLTPKPLEGRLDRCTIVGANAPLWREKNGETAFLLRFTDGVYSCELPKKGALKKLRKIERHEALGNLPAAKPTPPPDPFTFDGKALVTFENGKEAYRYEVPQRRNFPAPPPLVARLGGQPRIVTRTVEGTLIALDAQGGDPRDLLRQRPVNMGSAPIGEAAWESPIIRDMDGDGNNEIVLTDDDKRSVLILDEQGNVKRRIAPIPGATGQVLGVTGKLGPGRGRWLVISHSRLYERNAVAAYDGKTGERLWVRDNYTDGQEPAGFAPRLPTAVVDYNGDGADDLICFSANHYGIMDVKGNRDLVGPLNFTGQIPTHWCAYGTPMLARFLGGKEPRVFLSRSYCTFLSTNLNGLPLWHYGIGRDAMPQAHCGLTDLDGDGKTEMVGSRGDGLLRAFDGPPLNQKCPLCPPKEPLSPVNHGGHERWQTKLPGPVSDISSADLDGDGKGELLVGAGDGKLYALKEANRKCEVLWSKDLGAPVGSPVLADLDGDGQAEILAATQDGRLHCLGR